MSDLVSAGKIRSFGASKVPASQIVEAQWTADRRGHGRFRTEQPPYSMLTRAIEYDVLPTCLRYGMGVMSYSPLAGGWLSGKYRKGHEISGPGTAARAQRFPGVYDSTNPANEAKLDAADALGALADEAGISLIQMAIAFVTRHPAVTSAIIGPRTMEHLESYLAADGTELSADVLDRIDEIVPPGSRSTSPTTCGGGRPWTSHSAAGDAGWPPAGAGVVSAALGRIGNERQPDPREAVASPDVDPVDQAVGADRQLEHDLLPTPRRERRHDPGVIGGPPRIGGGRLVQPPAGAAGELLGRVGGSVEHLSDLLERHGEHLVQHVRDALRRRESLEHDPERAADLVDEQDLLVCCRGRRRVPVEPSRGCGRSPRRLPHSRASCFDLSEATCESSTRDPCPYRDPGGRRPA